LKIVSVKVTRIKKVAGMKVTSMEKAIGMVTGTRRMAGTITCPNVS
jgi:hypothetical protein